MILEVAMLDVLPDRVSQFEEAFKTARNIISRQQGFISLGLQRCIEKSNRYILLVNWRTMEDHTIGFRGSTDYLEWKPSYITSMIRSPQLSTTSCCAPLKKAQD